MNIEKYINVFKETFSVKDNELVKRYAFNKSEGWDSVGHMMLCAALEDTFSIHLEGEDILNIKSYVTGIDILKKYGVVFEEI